MACEQNCPEWLWWLNIGAELLRKARLLILVGVDKVDFWCVVWFREKAAARLRVDIGSQSGPCARSLVAHPLVALRSVLSTQQLGSPLQSPWLNPRLFRPVIERCLPAWSSSSSLPSSRRPSSSTWVETRLRVRAPLPSPHLVITLIYRTSRRGLDQVRRPDFVVRWMGAHSCCRYAIPESDVWVHVDKLSSAHVYLRMPAGWNWEEIPAAVLQDVGQVRSLGPSNWPPSLMLPTNSSVKRTLFRETRWTTSPSYTRLRERFAPVYSGLRLTAIRRSNLKKTGDMCAGT